MSEKNLCKPCAEKLKESYKVKMVKAGKNIKITCAECGRRRYGATYETEAK